MGPRHSPPKAGVQLRGACKTIKQEGARGIQSDHWQLVNNAMRQCYQPWGWRASAAAVLVQAQEADTCVMGVGGDLVNVWEV